MKALFVAPALALSMAVPSFAADLVIDAPEAYADPVASGFYIQLLGGAAFGGTLDHDEAGDVHGHDLAAGYAVAGVVGYEFVEGISFEVDGLLTSREIDEDDYFLTTASLMAGVRFTLDVTDGVSVYAGAALGALWSDDEMWEDESSGLGYQLKAGVEVEVVESVSLVGEFRYQAPLSELEFKDSDDSNDFGTAAVLAGVKFAF